MQHGRGTTLIGYVNVDGQAISPDRDWLTYDVEGEISPTVTELTVVDSGGDRWELDIERNPDASSWFSSHPRPVPSRHGGIFWTVTGPATESEAADSGTSVAPVVAELQQGAGWWWQLPDRWRVAASDVWGTVLTRETFEEIELAWFDPMAAGASDDEQAVPLTPVSTPDLGTPTWSGRRDVDFETGNVTLEGFNDFVEAEQPSWATSPTGIGRMVAGEVAEGEWIATAVGVDDSGRVVVAVTAANLLDDSTFAVRYRLVLEAGDDGRYRFVEGSWSQRCQPGRGHQTFSTEFCI